MLRRLILTPFLSVLCNIIGGKQVDRKDRLNFWRNYTKYLRTWRWQFRRKLVKMRDGNKCRYCHRGPAYNVHHLTYDRVGRERLSDLVLACDRCHKQEHPR